jgi:glycosyltransferase involved in cell wall biosynthesis
MKVAICISESVLGGVSQSSAMLALELSRQGHETDILVTGKAGVAYVGEIRRRGCTVIILCEGKLWLRERLKIVSQAVRNYDVLVNTHSLELQLLAPEIPSDKVLVNIVRNVVTGKKVIMNDRFFDAHIAISPGVAEHLMMFKATAPVYVIPNAVEITSDFLPQLTLPLQIAYLGRLEKGKNVKVLPEIFRQLSTRIDCRLTLVGDGPEEAGLKKLFAEEMKQGRVCFAGSCSRDELPSILGKSNFLLVPSFFEGFGLVVAEAMACGVVPIASNLPSFTWILGADAERLQVENNDNAEEYAERICLLAEDPAECRNIQMRLRARQRERFTPPVTAAKYIDLFKRCGSARPNKQRPVRYNQVMPREFRLRQSVLFYLAQVGKKMITGSK